MPETKAQTLRRLSWMRSQLVNDRDDVAAQCAQAVKQVTDIDKANAEVTQIQSAHLDKIEAFVRSVEEAGPPTTDEPPANDPPAEDPPADPPPVDDPATPPATGNDVLELVTPFGTFSSDKPEAYMGIMSGTPWMSPYLIYQDIQGPWYAEFRIGPDRQDVSLGLGGVLDGAAPFNQPPYTAIIRRNGITVAEVEVGRHDWGTHPRLWQSGPCPVVDIRPPELPPVDWSLDKSGDIAEVAYAGPMKSRHNITNQFHMTGERWELGFLPETSMEFLKSRHPMELATVLAQAETHGFFNNHVRENLTWLNYLDSANWGRAFNASGEDKIARAGGALMDLTSELGTAHYPQLVWVAWLATRDPYYVEELQAMAIAHLAVTSWWRTGTGGPRGLVVLDQLRQWAWSLEAAAFAYYATPVDAPLNLLPRNVFKRMVDDHCRIALERGRDPNNNRAKYFRYWFPHHSYDGGQLGFWQFDWSLIPLGYIIRLGIDADIPSVRELYEWCLPSLKARTSGSSGWPPQWSTPYWLGKHGDGSYIGDKETTWSELWHAGDYDSFPADPDERPEGGDWFYRAYTHAALGLACCNGYDFAAEFDRFDRWLRDWDEMPTKLCFARS